MPFTGGRSWNMWSHFQRSDGFDVWSQVFAATRLREGDLGDAASAGAPATPRRWPRARRRRRRTAATPSSAATSVSTSQSSRASPGRRHHPGRRLQQAAIVRVGGFLLDPRGAGQYDVRGGGQGRHQHALHDEQRQLAGLTRVEQPLHVAEAAFGPRIDDVERLDRAGVDLRAQAADVARPAAPSGTRKPSARAPATLGASTGGIGNVADFGCSFSECFQPIATLD